MKKPHLQAMLAFRRVVEMNSFNAAANSLETTGGSVSKLVAQLEQDLGARLLNRTTRRVSVTEEGSAFYEATARILDEVDQACEQARSRSAAPAGRLKVSVPTSFGLMWLSSRLPAFMLEHPRLQLDLALNDRFVDIVQEGFDCAIRITGQLPDSSLVARRLGSAPTLLVAAPRYLEAAPALERPEDLADHACLAYSQAGAPTEWPLRGTAQGRPVRVVPNCRVNNSVMLRELLAAGLGLTLTPRFVVHDLLASGTLVEVLPRCRPDALTVYGVVAHQRYTAQKVRALLDFVEAQLAHA